MPYNNLKAEMARNNIRQSDIAKTINKSISNTNERINGKRKFSCDDAMLVRDAHFPALAIEYLFKGE